MFTDDTIAAVSTPPGRGGIGIVRLSGPQSLEIARALVRIRAAEAVTPQQVYFGEFLEPATGEKIDEVLLTYFRKPHSYTAEDVVELAAHGSPVVLRHLLECVLARGARLAEPGEFTLRAFLNGRIDLTQAEAVRDLIEAQTLYQAKVAAQQLSGSISERLKPAKQKLVDLIAMMEAGIDFAEDDVTLLTDEQILAHMAAVREPLAAFLQTYHHGKIVHEGLVLAIVGRPNVGKSSIFNRLVGQDRAIVTATPGTTRDLVSETLSLAGIPIQLVDTAGIRQARDEAEAIGVQKSYQALVDSDIILLVLDRSRPLDEEDRSLLERILPLVPHCGTVLVVNKCDLRAAWSEETLAAWLEEMAAYRAAEEMLGAAQQVQGTSVALPPKVAVADGAAAGLHLAVNAARERPALSTKCEGWVNTSATTGEGVEALRKKILSVTVPALDMSREPQFITNVRHHKLIQEAISALDAARASTDSRVPHEMILLDLYNALRPLNTITGETTVEDILNQIFSTFCVGK